MLTPSKSEHLTRRIIVSKGDVTLETTIVGDYIVPPRFFFMVNNHIYTLGLIFWPISGLVAIFKSFFAFSAYKVKLNYNYMWVLVSKEGVQIICVSLREFSSIF